MRKFLKASPWILVGLTLLVSGLLIHNSQARARQAMLEAHNLRAELDTTRLVLQSETDQRRLYERRAFQLEQDNLQLHGLAQMRADSLDAQAYVIGQLTLAYEDVRAQLVGSQVQEDSAGVRYAHLEADTLGTHVEVDVTVPAPPDSATGSVLVEHNPEQVWLYVLETPEGERLLEVETSTRVQAAIDSVAVLAPEPPRGLFSIPQLNWNTAKGVGIGLLIGVIIGLAR